MKGRGESFYFKLARNRVRFVVLVSCFINEAPILPPEYNTTLNKIVSRHLKNTEFTDRKCVSEMIEKTTNNARYITTHKCTKKREGEIGLNVFGKTGIYIC
jgi:hypothetical protein